ncbi:unnamed protein product, partial [Mesorhabditis spiculigera]
MTPAAEIEKPESEIKASTSHPAISHDLFKGLTAASAPNSPATNGIPAQPQRRMPTRIEQLKLRYLKRRALKPYNRTPLPSISCLLPIRENYTPPETISPVGLDACAFGPDAWCCDEFYDWTDVYVPSFCNWPQQPADTAVPCYAQAAQQPPVNYNYNYNPALLSTPPETGKPYQACNVGQAV